MVLPYGSVQQKARIGTISIQDCQAGGSLAGKLSARDLSIALSLLCSWLQSSITRSSGSRSCLSPWVSIAPPVTIAILCSGGISAAPVRSDRADLLLEYVRPVRQYQIHK